MWLSVVLDNRIYLRNCEVWVWEITCSRWTIEQDALGRFDADSQEEFWVHEGKLDGFPELPNLLPQSTNCWVVYLPRIFLLHVEDHRIHLFKQRATLWDNVLWALIEPTTTTSNNWQECLCVFMSFKSCLSSRAATFTLILDDYASARKSLTLNLQECSLERAMTSIPASYHAIYLEWNAIVLWINPWDMGQRLGFLGGSLTSLGRIRMMVRVVMSKETRAPDISLALLTFARHPTTYLGPLLAFTMTAPQESRSKSLWSIVGSMDPRQSESPYWSEVCPWEAGTRSRNDGFCQACVNTRHKTSLKNMRWLERKCRQELD